MRRVILDPKLIDKLAKRRGKSEKYIREMVSKLAHKHGVPSEVALVVLARKNGFGTAIYQRNLDSDKRAQVREILVSISATEKPRAERLTAKEAPRKRVILGRHSSLKLVAQNLNQDSQLRARCMDLLTASSSYDRAINQATQILEDRIRKKAAPPKPMTGEPLVGFAFNEDLAKTVLRVDSGEADDQRGFTQMLRGVVPAFRNKTHHHITEGFSQEDAMRVVGFIDVLLRVVDKSVNTKSDP